MSSTHANPQQPEHPRQSQRQNRQHTALIVALIVVVIAVMVGLSWALMSQQWSDEGKARSSVHPHRRSLLRAAASSRLVNPRSLTPPVRPPHLTQPVRLRTAKRSRKVSRFPRSASALAISLRRRTRSVGLANRSPQITRLKNRSFSRRTIER